ncbi:hypothetical protein [Bosea sp. ANAM02]|uniref:hypothetical protein n=1 Tax=Bosea sp. ANAM02 TaxID=2020412 RepID=UPI00140EE6D8|nr:hypothetical protein [Bosea sp. ANAM02]BCB22096.1 hypothetical protein OCUBac02_49900 [Bosea sp. ANAM02]
MRAFLAAAVLVTATSYTAIAETDPLIAVVDGRAITQSSVESVLIENGMMEDDERDEARQDGRLRQTGIVQAVERAALAAAAERDGLDKNPVTMEQIKEAPTSRDGLLREVWMTKVESDLRSQTDTARVKAFYEKASTGPRYALRFLTYTTRQAATEALKTVTDRASFDAEAARMFGSKQETATSQIQDVMEATSAWAWRLQGLSIDTPTAGAVGGPFCEWPLCSIWIVEKVETAPTPAFDQLDEKQIASLRGMSVFLKMRSAYSTALAAAKIEWKEPAPESWTDLARRISIPTNEF